MSSLSSRLFWALSAGFAAATAVFWLAARAAGAALAPAARPAAAVYAAAMLMLFAAAAGACGRRWSRALARLAERLDAPRGAPPPAEPELRELAARADALRARADEDLANLREYAARVAHELRTPLTVLRLKIEQAAGSMPPALAEDLQNELARLSRIAEQSILLARVEQGAVAPELAIVDLQRLLADAAEDFRLLAREQGREVRTELEVAPTRGDAKLLRQIFYALLTNALRHGRGDIRVRLREHGAGYSLLIVNAAAERADESGLGLGLRVAEALTRLHGARLTRRRGRQAYAALIFFPSTAPRA